jgi:hypothetical protein
MAIYEPQTSPEQLQTQDYWDERNFDPERLQALVDQEIDRALGENPDAPPKTILRMIDADDPAAALGRHIEHTVFMEKFGNDIDLLRAEYTPYEPYSKFILAINVENREPAGVIRVILPNDKVGLKSLNDITDSKGAWGIDLADLRERMIKPELDPAKTLDVATLALPPKYRGGDLLEGTAPLYYVMYQYSLENGLDHWIGVLDEKPMGKIQELCNPLDTFDGVEAAAYLDSASSIPFYANMQRIHDRLLQKDRDLNDLVPEAQKTAEGQGPFFGYFVKGVGVDPQNLIYS